MMQQGASRSLGDRVVNILEQLLQHLSDSPSDSDDDDVGVAELIVDVHVLDRPNYAEDADVRLHEVELPPVVAEQTSNFRRRSRKRRTGARGVDARSLIPKRRSCSDEVLCRFRSRSALRVRERTPP